MLNQKVIRGGIILFIAFGLFNVINFLYQFAMVRMLSVSDYGVLATLFAIVSIFAVFSESIQTVIAKYSVEADSPGKLRDLITRSIKKANKLAIKTLIFYLIVSLALAYYFEISYLLFVLNGIILYIIFLLPVPRGAIQGNKKFFALGTSLVVEATIKIILSIFLVWAGLRVYGALIATIFGVSVAFMLSFIALRNAYAHKSERFEQEGIYSYAKPTLWITAIVVLFYNLDILVAKLVFNPEDAGSYAIASILGKMILWISIPIGKAMFPLSAEAKKKNEKKNNILKTTLIILTGFIVCTLFIFYMFSESLIWIFSGKSIPEAVNILFTLGASFSIIAVANILLLYQLSIGKIRRYWILVICNIVEIFLLLLFNSSLEVFSYAFAVSSLILLAGSILFARANRHI